MKEQAAQIQKVSAQLVFEIAGVLVRVVVQFEISRITHAITKPTRPMTNTILPSWGSITSSKLKHVIGDASFHCRSYAQRLMNPAEVVVHEIRR